MSYVDSRWDKEKDIVYVVERDNDRNRVYKEYAPSYVMYYEDPKGKYKSIYNTNLTKISCSTHKDFMREQKIYSSHKQYEGDIKVVFKCLSDNYLDKPAPNLNVLFYDIETDFSYERGYSSPEEAFLPITAFSLYLQWLDVLICLAIPPKTLSLAEARELVKDMPNTFIFATEAEMLNEFLALIEDADVLSGWNSESFDIPYTVNRITNVLGKSETRRMCLWNQLPKKREYEKFGKTAFTYDLVGRVHLDSLNLYKKYTYEERHSYRLDAIAEYELGDQKTPYDGTLDQLYNNDFKKFIEYSRQDSALLGQLDKKLKFIDLANTIAHDNTVLIPNAMGAVAISEQAIINEAHYRGMLVPNRSRIGSDESTQAAGAYVAYPKKGMHDWVGSMDINSLYPSVIRALNASTETIVGQLRQSYTDPEIAAKMEGSATVKKMSFAAAWEGKFSSNEYEFVMNHDRANDIIIDWENGETNVMTGAEIYQMVFESGNNWMVSANGTIFDCSVEGIIPGLLKKWYIGRQEMQVKLRAAIETGDQVQIEYWDKLQLVRKILLNSLYGGLLNAGCKFFDKRLGQSVTLTGRQIVKHMSAKANETITGEYDYVGDSVLYNDTDSVYFSAYPMLKSEIAEGLLEWNKDSVVKLYDSISDEVNSTFPDFMLTAFNCPKSRGVVIKAGREIVATKALFITKKRYALLYYDKDGKRQDKEGKEGKLKAMGLDLKRADTPVYVQKFLEQVLMKVLHSAPEAEILDHITEFRLDFRARPGWEKGGPKAANNISSYRTKEAEKGKITMPGQVRASINWNTLRRLNSDKFSMEIVDGMKVSVLTLKPNPMGFASVAFPTDELRMPEWFKELPFDDAEMEIKLIDAKLDNLIGVLKYDLDRTKMANTFNSLFDFD